MSYSVKQGNIFGRIGSGIGQGLADQIPKEIERNRLSQGLQALETQGSNLSPFQQFSRLSAIPGITPQMIQSGAELLKQGGVRNALVQGSSPQGGQSTPSQQDFKNAQFNAAQNQGQNQEGSPESQSLTTRTPLEATLNPYIPKSLPEIQNRAGQLLQQSPGLYPNPQDALQAAIQEDAQNQAVNAALQGQRTNEQGIQDRLAAELKNRQETLGAKIPGNVEAELLDKATNSVKPKNQGGEGLTEREAAQKYGKQMDEISRQYQDLYSVGNWSILNRSPQDNKRNLKAIRDKFKERNDLENLADQYITQNGLSPSKAYYLAYPVSDSKSLNNAMVKLPALKKDIVTTSGTPIRQVPKDVQQQKSLEASERIGKLMDQNSSPLSIAEEFQAKGYDPEVWLNYVQKNRKNLNLTERQARELDKPRNIIPTLNDLWLFSLSGLDKLVEQE